MPVFSSFLGTLSGVAVMVAGFAPAQAQITITSTDMFNQVGQYYRAYANETNTTVDVSSLLGSTGGPQAWDFTTGPQDVTYRYDYIPASQGTGGADFVAAGAQIASRQTNEGDTNDQQFLYFTLDPAKGQLDYGFYDPTFSASQPESVFTNSLQDFPASIHYGDTWTGSTVFGSIYSVSGLGDYPVQLTYTSTDTVDAYGLVNLPSIGFLDCLRVHELVEYDIALDLGDGSGYQNAGTEYILNYYWLVPGHGIAVQINSTSPQDGSKPPDSLPGGATALVRMFEANHPTATTNPPTTIKGFKMTLGASAALLQWTTLAGVKSYTVEYSTNIASTTNWQTLATTTSNYALDPAAVTPAAPIRFYRVVGSK